MQGVREVASEVIDLRSCIDKKDRPVHTGCNDLPGEFETFLPGCAKDMDVAAVLLDAAEVQRDRCCSAGAVRLDMFRFGVDGLDKRGLSCPKGTTIFSFLSAAIRIKLGRMNVYRFGRIKA